MEPKLRAFLFDLDGVLVDTEPLYTLATQEVIAPFGKTYDWALKAQCMGNAATVSARIIVERLGLPLTPQCLIERRKPILERLLQTVPEMPGAGALLERLAKQGFKLGLATSSDRRLLTLKTRHHAWMSHFAALVTGDDSELLQPKPAPDIFLLCAKRLGVTPDECVVVEDSPAGVQASLAAGMRVIAFCDPSLDRALLPRAVRMISSFSELDPLDLAATGE